MSFLSIGSKSQTTPSRKAKPLPNRFIDGGGFGRVGSAKHAPRTNTEQEIKESILLKLEEYDKRRQFPEKNLIDKAEECGVDLKEMMKSDKIDAFEAASRLGIRNTRQKNGYMTQTVNFTKLAQTERARKSIYDHNYEGLKSFAENMGVMPKRHLSVAHDILDLNSLTTLINHSIFPEVMLDQIAKDKNGKQTSFLQDVFEMLPKLSKENPEILNLLDTVFSNSDNANSKFFLDKMFKQIDGFKGIPEQIKETEDFVPVFAETFLDGMPSMYLDEGCKENQFFTSIQNLCNKETKPQNLRLFKQALEIADECNPDDALQTYFDLAEMRKGDTEKIEENMKILPDLLKNAHAQHKKVIDVSGFLTKNVNMG